MKSYLLSLSYRLYLAHIMNAIAEYFIKQPCEDHMKVHMLRYKPIQKF